LVVATADSFSNMYLKYYRLFILVLAVAGCSSVPKPKPIPAGSLGEFQKKAEKFNEIVNRAGV